MNALPSPPRDGTSDAAGTEGEELLADHDVPVVVISSYGKEGTRVVPPINLPSEEQVVILASLGIMGAGSSGGSEVAHELVWPHLDEPGKAQFVLRDGREDEL